MRRILYEHLGISCGLECEVATGVGAAVLATPKVEKAGVTMESAGP